VPARGAPALASLASAAPEAAQSAGLHYVNDAKPGIRRIRAGTGFYYERPDGSRISDPEVLARIRALAIPPAYRDVWIAVDPRGHIQATARDAKGRKQYRYHPAWRAIRDTVKFERMLAFADALPRVREAVDQDLELPGLPKRKVLAAIVRLLERTHIRVGNEEYTRQNKSFGLTTLRNRHVQVIGDTVRFHFRGKSGKEHRVRISDKRLSRLVRRCMEIPGCSLFEYLDHEGAAHVIDSGDVNAYLKEISGQEFTAKDFRTWAGTVTAARLLRDSGPHTTQRELKRKISASLILVAEELGNTPAVCRKSYIHPAVLESYASGLIHRFAVLAPRARQHRRQDDPHALTPDERFAVHLLRSMQSEAKEKAKARRSARAGAPAQRARPAVARLRH
jgi:DNA topoisomerase-1